MRSRAVSLPRSCWRSTAASRPGVQRLFLQLGELLEALGDRVRLGRGRRGNRVVSHPGTGQSAVDGLLLDELDSVPNAVFGCTNATVVPRLPGRGASSITR